MKVKFSLGPNQYLLFCWFVGILGIDNKIDYKGCYKVVRDPFVSFTITIEDLELVVQCMDKTFIRCGKLFSRIERNKLYELKDVLTTYLDSYK